MGHDGNSGGGGSVFGYVGTIAYFCEVGGGDTQVKGTFVVATVLGISLCQI